MINNSIPTPAYTYEPEIHIRLFADLKVPKSFYDNFWQQAARYVSKMGPDSEVSIKDVLDPGILDLLSEEGIFMAEECLSHFAGMKMLPLTPSGLDDMCSPTFTIDQ